MRRAALSLAALNAGDEALAIAIMNGKGKVSDSLFNAVLHEILNGRCDAARKILERTQC